MSAEPFSLDELEGAPFEATASFHSAVSGRWAWDRQGGLWRVRDYVRQEYWGERVLEAQSHAGGWRKDIRESELRGLSPEAAAWLRELSEERVAGIGKALAERWELRESAQSAAGAKAPRL